MERFIKKTLHFLSIIIIYSGIMYSINYAIYKFQIPDNKDFNILIMGDSHPQTSLNPENFKSAENLAQQAEPYYITYWKLKNYLFLNTVDSVIIGFSYHNISEFNDLKLSDKFWSQEMFRRIYPLKGFTEVKNLEIEVDMEDYFKVKFSNMCLYPKSHKEYIGSFDPEPAVTDLSNVNDVIERHYFVNGELAEISEISIRYLDSIIQLCRKKKYCSGIDI